MPAATIASITLLGGLTARTPAPRVPRPVTPISTAAAVTTAPGDGQGRAHRAGERPAREEKRPARRTG